MGEKTVTESSPPAGAKSPTVSAKSPPVGAKSPRRWVRATLDRVPTKWASTIGVGVFLAATAAFGGLAEVPPPDGPAEVGPHELVTTPNLEMTVTRAFISDRVVGGPSIGPDDHARVLAVEIEVTNLFDSFRMVRSELEGLGPTRIIDGPDETPDVSRPGETANSSILMQPGLTERFILSWLVDPDEYHEGDEVRIALANPESARWEFLDQNLHWSNNAVSAYATVALDDLGEGDPR